MPIISIIDYTWRQTPEEIIITMPVKGNPTKIDVFAIDNYVKASYPPFILELFLFDNIVEEDSQCTLGESSAVFTLKKTEIGREWKTLVQEGLTKEKKREYRTQAMERAQLSAERKAKQKCEKQRELQRQAVRKQIELNTTTFNKIESIRDSHRREAMTEFDNWRNHAENPMFVDAQPTIQSNRKAYKAPVKYFRSKSTGKPAGETDSIKCQNDMRTIENPIAHDENVNIFDNTNINSTDELKDTKNPLPSKSSTPELRSFPMQPANDEKLDELIKNETEKARPRGKKLIDKILNGEYRTCKRSVFEDTKSSTPMPRQNATINVKFSERVFPTPARESHALEEQEWLEKQVEARRKCGFASEDLRAEEQDPQWLKDKGDEFFKAGNYFAAISAYTHGIKLSDKMASLYANRSAAQYALGNYRRCAEDCSTALQLMTPKCEGNRESRARCHARLGAALCKLSAPQHGIPELEAALKLAPDNDTIKHDLNEARKFFKVAN